MSTNSPWVSIKDAPMPDGESVLLYLSKDHIGSRFVVATSMKINGGYLVSIGGLFKWYFETETILAWRRLEDLKKELPIGLE